MRRKQKRDEDFLNRQKNRELKLQKKREKLRMEISECNHTCILPTHNTLQKLNIETEQFTQMMQNHRKFVEVINILIVSYFIF